MSTCQPVATDPTASLPLIDLIDEAATARLAARLGQRLRRGDCVLLDGPVGAGKSALARALIHSLQDVPEDVPSPTFTLVQSYDTRRGAVWHADLYRLTSSDEIEELGLIDAFSQAICLIEWPDRLGDLVPRDALWITLSLDPVNPDGRRAAFSSEDPGWTARLRGIADD